TTDSSVTIPPDWLFGPFPIQSPSPRFGTMIVNCPYCSTRYEVDAARLASPNPMLKCSRCRHIFPAPSSKKRAASPPAAAAKAKQADGANLSLPFDEPGWKDEAEAPAADSFDESEPDEGFVLGTGERTEEQQEDVEPVAAESHDRSDSAAADDAEPPAAGKG